MRLVNICVDILIKINKTFVADKQRIVVYDGNNSTTYCMSNLDDGLYGRFVFSSVYDKFSVFARVYFWHENVYFLDPECLLGKTWKGMSTWSATPVPLVLL